jgi:hypothetical protein
MQGLVLEENLQPLYFTDAINIYFSKEIHEEKIFQM